MNRERKRTGQNTVSDGRFSKKESKYDKPYDAKKRVYFKEDFDDEVEEKKKKATTPTAKKRPVFRISSHTKTSDPKKVMKTEMKKVKVEVAKKEEKQKAFSGKPSNEKPQKRQWADITEEDEGKDSEQILKEVIAAQKLMTENKMLTVPVAIIQQMSIQNNYSIDDDERALLFDALPTYAHERESKQALSFELVRQRYEAANPGTVLNENLTVSRDNSSHASQFIGGFSAYLSHLKSHVRVKSYYGEVKTELRDLFQKLLFFVPPVLREKITPENIAGLVQNLIGERGKLEPRNLPSLQVVDQIMASRVTSNIAWFAKAVMTDSDGKRQSPHQYIDFVSAIGTFGVAVAAANKGREYRVHNVCPYPVAIGVQRCMPDFVYGAVKLLAGKDVIETDRVSFHQMSVGSFNENEFTIDASLLSNAKVNFFLCAERFVTDFISANLPEDAEDSWYVRLSLNWKKDLHWSYYSEENTKSLLGFLRLVSNLVTLQRRRNFVVSLSLPSARTVDKDTSVHFLNALRRTAQATQQKSQKQDPSAAFVAGSASIYCYGLHDQEINHLHFSPNRPQGRYTRVWQKSMFSLEFDDTQKTFVYRDYSNAPMEQKYTNEGNVGYGYYQRYMKYQDGELSEMYRLSPFIKDDIRGEADSLYKREDKDKHLTVMFKFIGLPAQVRQGISMILQHNLAMDRVAHRSMSYRQADVLLGVIQHFLPDPRSRILAFNPGLGALSIRINESYTNLAVAYGKEPEDRKYIQYHEMIVRTANPSYSVSMRQDQAANYRVFIRPVAVAGSDWVHFCFDWKSKDKKTMISEKVRTSVLADLRPFNNPLNTNQFAFDRWFLFIVSYTIPRPELTLSDAAKRKLTALETKENADRVPITRYEVNHNRALRVVAKTFEKELAADEIELLISVSGLMYYVYLFYVRQDDLLAPVYKSRASRHEWFRLNLPASALTSAFLLCSYDEKSEGFVFKEVKLTNPFLP